MPHSEVEGLKPSRTTDAAGVPDTAQVLPTAEHHGPCRGDQPGAGGRRGAAEAPSPSMKTI